MRQVILVTDGCSNEGISPVVAAAYARAEGIPVNVIGVVDQGEMGQRGAAEIADIAKSSGGLSRIVTSRELAQTMQMMTRKTVMNTVHLAMRRELQGILGSESLEAVAPAQRAQIVHAMEEVGENAALQVALLVDTSASMRSKLPAVKEAIGDLMLSLKARAGRSEAAVFRYPSFKGTGSSDLELGWTIDLDKCQALFYKIDMRGTTPTGPALYDVIRWMAAQEGEDGRREPRLRAVHPEELDELKAGAGNGVYDKGSFHEYII